MLEGGLECRVGTWMIQGLLAGTEGERDRVAGITEGGDPGLIRAADGVQAVRAKLVKRNLQYTPL